MSKLVGLTGGIGSGKTTVGQMFADLGVPIYNSDIEAKRLMETSMELKNALIELLGEDAFQGERLNKTYISKQIFNDTSLLKSINSIVHPVVRKHFFMWANCQNTIYVIQEAAIIFEIGSQDFYDRTILVTAPENARIERVIKRNPNISTEDIVSRMQSQWKDSKKTKLSDYVIENLDLQKTKATVFDVHRKLMARFPSAQF